MLGEGIATSETETLKEAVEQSQQREKLEWEIAKLRAQMRKEKQLEIKREIQRLENN